MRTFRKTSINSARALLEALCRYKKIHVCEYDWRVRGGRLRFWLWFLDRSHHAILNFDLEHSVFAHIGERPLAAGSDSHSGSAKAPDQVLVGDAGLNPARILPVRCRRWSWRALAGR